jgi:phage-related protein
MLQTILMRNYIAYQGKRFTIEWYFSNKKKSQSKEYFQNLEITQKNKAMNLFQLMGEVGKILNIEKFRNEGDGIYAFKPQPDRFLCFFAKGNKIIISNGFLKKTEKLPKSEKEKALRCMQDYIERNQNSIYYKELDDET